MNNVVYGKQIADKNLKNELFEMNTFITRGFTIIKFGSSHHGFKTLHHKSYWI